MPSLSQRPRRRPAQEDHEDEPPRRRRRTPVEEEKQEEEEENAEEDEEEDDDVEEDVEEEGEEEEEEPRSRRQRQSQGQSQSQSQSQRRRPRASGRRRQVEEEDDDDDDNEDGELPQTQANRQQLHQQLLAKKLVRYALACEPRRVPIRRQAVKEQVLDNEGKHFRTVFPMAQSQLREIFGMELVEWPARDETTMSVRERRKALKTQKQQPGAATQGTQRKGAAAAPPVQRMDRYVLLSTLPEVYREAVFAPIPLENTARNPPASDAAYVGFYTLVVALITLSGGSMAHNDLEKYLGLLYGTGGHHLVRTDEDFMKPMAAMMGDHVDDDDGGAGGVSQTQDGDASAQGGTLQHLVRQGYVVRVVEESTAGGSSMHSGAKVTWHVGPRGRLEIGPAEVAAVVRHIYGPDADEEMEQQLESSLRAATNAANKGEKKSRGGRIEQEQQRQQDEDGEDAEADN